MRARHPLPLPRVWLMTDERLGDDLWQALRRVPPGGGVIFRHYATPAGERRWLFLKVRRAAQARRLVVVSARGLLPGANGVHGIGGSGLITWSAHDRRQAIAAKRAGAHIVFVSPVFATRSHSGSEGLGPMRGAGVAMGLGMQVIALGGMNARRYRRLRPLGFYGWAGIDAFTPATLRQSRTVRHS